MTINEIHVGLELILQNVYSNIFGKLQAGEKDFFINNTIDELLRAVLLKEENTVFTLLTYADIREYFEILQSHFKELYLTVEEDLGEGRVTCLLPNSTPGDVTSGNLIKGASYRVIVAGSEDLTGFGSTNPPVIDTEFTCVLANLSGTPITFTSGDKYRIVNADDFDFTTIGAANSLPGTEFICDTTGSQTTGTRTDVEVLESAPSWAGSTLENLGTLNYYLYSKSSSYIKYGKAITSGSLTKGKQYIVHDNTSLNLTTVGGTVNPDVGYMFTADASAAPTWGTGVLYQLKPYVNRLVKNQDVRNFLENSFAESIDSPITEIKNYALNVYHDDKFSINRVKVDYVRRPRRTNHSQDVTTDLPESIHAKLVDLTASYINAKFIRGRDTTKSDK